MLYKRPNLAWKLLKKGKYIRQQKRTCIKNLFLFFKCLWQGCTPTWNTHEIILYDTQVKQRWRNIGDSIILYWTRQMSAALALPPVVWPGRDHFTSLRHSLLGLWNKDMGPECLSLHHTDSVSLSRNDLKGGKHHELSPSLQGTGYTGTADDQWQRSRWSNGKAAAVLQGR